MSIEILIQQSIELAGTFERGRSKAPISDNLQKIQRESRRFAPFVQMVYLDQETANLVRNRLNPPFHPPNNEAVGDKSANLETSPTRSPIQTYGNNNLINEIWCPTAGSVPGEDIQVHEHQNITKADVVFIVGRCESRLSREELERLDFYQASAVVAGCIQLRKDSNGNGEAANWSKELTFNCLFSAYLDSSDTIPSIFEKLQHASKNWWETIYRLRTVNRWLSAARLLSEQIDIERRVISSRRRLIFNRLDHFDRGNPEQSVREYSDAIRRLLDDSCSKLSDSLAEEQRQRCLPNSAINNRIKNSLDDITAADLIEENRNRTIRTHLSSDLTLQLQELLRSSAIHDLQSDLDSLNRKLRSIAADVTATLTELGLNQPRMALDLTNSAEYESLVHEEIFVDPKIKGELPAKSFMDRLNYGRRPVFAATMVLSLLGGAFGLQTEFRTLLAPAMLFLFLLGVFWTYRSFVSEYYAKVDRILENCREKLAIELRRLYESTLRVWQQRANQLVLNSHKTLWRQASEYLSEWGDRLSKQNLQTRQEHKDRLKLIESKDRELEKLSESLIRLQRQGHHCKIECESALAKLN